MDAPPAKPPEELVEPAPVDDLAQVALRAVLAGPIAALAAAGAVGGYLAWMSASGAPLVGAPGAALAFVLGAGLGAGAAFGAAEAVCVLPPPRVPAAARWTVALLALALLGPVGPLAGAFEVQLVQGGSSTQAWSEVVAALNATPLADLTHLSCTAVVLGLALLAVRRAGLGLLTQVATLVVVTATWLLAEVVAGAPGSDAPVCARAALLFGGALGAPPALALADRALRRLRRRPPPAASAPPPRRWARRALAAATIAATAWAGHGLFAPDPGTRAAWLRVRLLAFTTRDPGSLDHLLFVLEDDGEFRWDDEPWARLADRLRLFAPDPELPGPPATATGLSLGPLLAALGAQVPADDPWRGRRALVLRAVELGSRGALLEVASDLLWERQLGSPSIRAAWERLDPGIEDRLGELLAVRLAAGDAPWIGGVLCAWGLQPPLTLPRDDALARVLLVRARRGDPGATTGLARVWLTHPALRPEVEADLTRAANGDATLQAWRALEQLAQVSRSDEATPTTVDLAFAAARRHAAVEVTLAASRPDSLDPAVHAARRVLLELLVAWPGRRRLEDEDRLPDLPVDVPDLLDGAPEEWSFRAFPRNLAAALGQTPALPTGDGPGARALEAAARGDRAQALPAALAALARDPDDLDAHRALARLDLARGMVLRGPSTEEAVLSRAAGHLRHVFRLDPTVPGALLEQAALAARCPGGPTSWGLDPRMWLGLARGVVPTEARAPLEQALARPHEGEGEAEARAVQEARVLEAWRRHAARRSQLSRGP